jgi:hypothetical protein
MQSRQQQDDGLTMMMTEVVPVMTLYCPDFANRFNGQNIEDVMCEYMAQIRRNGLRKSDVRKGVERLKTRKDKWTPNPTEFVELCKPTIEELGIPNLETATHEVREARTTWRHSKTPFPFSHDVCRFIDQRVGYDLYQTSEREWRQRVSREYHYLVKQAIAGQLPSFRNALPHKSEPEDNRPMYERLGYKTLSREESRAVIDSVLKRKRTDNTDRGRVDTSRLGPGIAGSSNASTSAEQMTGSKPE